MTRSEIEPATSPAPDTYALAIHHRGGQLKCVDRCICQTTVQLYKHNIIKTRPKFRCRSKWSKCTSIVKDLTAHTHAIKSKWKIHFFRISVTKPQTAKNYIRLRGCASWLRTTLIAEKIRLFIALLLTLSITHSSQTYSDYPPCRSCW